MKIAALSILLLAFPALAGEAYGHLWWAHGFRGEKILHLQTDRYGAAFDPARAAFTRLGPLENGATYAEAAAQPNTVIDALPEADLTITIASGGAIYRCVRAAQDLDDHANYPIRLIEGGRFLNRFDVLALEFENDGGEPLPVEGRLAVSAWPGRLTVALYLTAASPLTDAPVNLTLTKADGEIRSDARAPAGPWKDTLAATLTWPPHSAPADVSSVAAREGAGPLPVSFDPALGAHVVALPPKQWTLAENLDRLDRFPVAVANTSDEDAAVSVVFAIEGSFQGVTGLVPMLLDGEGRPTGIPVQISKNWHRLPDKRLIHEGPWFRGATQIPVAAGESWEGVFAIAYARWGGVPAASHAQLSLVGWGGNQRWDQAAIGSNGESICYDPDVGLNRSMIDDVRPLMVTGMNGGSWEWTHNVGGGEFFFLPDAENRPQRLIRVKTAYLSQGPNLTDVIYAGVTPDGAIEANIRVQTPRTDDINRAYHRIRYDVRRPVVFSRLAFYQLGADHYNDHQFTTIARGNAEGLIEEWETERGGKRYLREAISSEGAAPWIALLGGFRGEQWPTGAWADRAIVLREWKARLGGKDAPVPHFAVYGTENGPHSANAELVPPPGADRLEPGDFVEAEIEMIVLPQRADDYYGPNAALKADLEANGGTWKAVHRLAAANEIAVAVERGSLIRRLPLEIACADGGAEAVVTGGAGYLPITFTGVSDPKAWRLAVDGVALDQAVHGNDFWQVDRDADGYRLTVNLPLDGPPRARRLTFDPARRE